MCTYQIETDTEHNESTIILLLLWFLHMWLLSWFRLNEICVGCCTGKHVQLVTYNAIEYCKMSVSEFCLPAATFRTKSRNVHLATAWASIAVVDEEGEQNKYYINFFFYFWSTREQKPKSLIRKLEDSVCIFLSFSLLSAKWKDFEPCLRMYVLCIRDRHYIKHTHTHTWKDLARKPKIVDLGLN